MTNAIATAFVGLSLSDANFIGGEYLNKSRKMIY